MSGLVGFFGLALPFLVLGLGPQENVRALANRVSPDGTSALFAGAEVGALQARMAVLGVLATALGILWCWRAIALPERLAACSREFAGSLRDGLGALVRFARAEPLHALGLALATLAGVGLLVALVDQTVRCDESYTALYYVSRPVHGIVTHYTSPNNHVLHTLAAHAVTSIFGFERWALRLPVLLAGAALVPVTYLATRGIFDRHSALLAALGVGTWLYLVDLSTNARGYPFVNLCFVLALALTPRLVVAGPSRAAWSAWVLVVAAGFWSVPTMLYPLSILVVWGAFEALFRLSRSQQAVFAVRLALALVLTALLVLALYSPTWIAYGDKIAFLSDQLKPSVDARGLEALPAWGGLLARAWGHWTFGYPAWIRVVLGASVLAACLVGRQRARAARLLLAAWIGPFLVFLVSGKLPPTRILSFLAPLLVILSAVGVVALVRLASRPAAQARAVALGALAAGLLGMGVIAVVEHRRDPERAPWYTGYFEAPLAARFLSETLAPGDRVAAARDQRSPLQFAYFEIMGERFRAFAPAGFVGARGKLPPDVVSSHDDPAQSCVFWVDTGIPEARFIRDSVVSEGYREAEVDVEFGRSRIVRFEYAPGTEGDSD